MQSTTPKLSDVKNKFSLPHIFCGWGIQVWFGSSRSESLTRLQWTYHLKWSHLWFSSLTRGISDLNTLKWRLANLWFSLAIGQRYQFLAMCIFSWRYSQLAAFHRGEGEGEGRERVQYGSCCLFVTLILEVASGVPTAFYWIEVNQESSPTQGERITQGCE